MNGDRPRPPPSPNAAVAVQVTSREIVVERGTATTIWYAEVEGEWCLVRDLPDTVVHEQEPGAGTVWQLTTAMRLAPGTRMKRVESSPGKETRLDPLGYLERGPRLAARATREWLFVVERTGRLVPEQKAPRRK